MSGRRPARVEMCVKKKTKRTTALLTSGSGGLVYPVLVAMLSFAKPLRPTEASASFITGLFSVPAPSIRSNAVRRGF